MIYLVGSKHRFGPRFPLPGADQLSTGSGSTFYGSRKDMGTPNESAAYCLLCEGSDGLTL